MNLKNPPAVRRSCAISILTVAAALAMCSSAFAQTSSLLGPVRSKNLANTADKLDYYSGGRAGDAELNFIRRSISNSVGRPLNIRPSDYLQARMGLGMDRDPAYVLRTKVFPGLSPARRFESNYMTMASPADRLIFRPRLYARPDRPYSPVVAAEIYGARPAATETGAEPPAPPPETPLGLVTVAMETEVRTALDRRLAEGWEWFSDTNYSLPGSRFSRAARAFESAESMDRTRTEARIGRLCCSLADRNFRFAARLLDRIVAYDVLQLQKNLFKPEFDLKAHLTSVSELVDIAKQWSDHPTAGPQAKAIYVYLLWHLGRRAEAVSLADDAARTWPDSPVAVMPPLMRAVTDQATSTVPPRRDVEP